MPDLSYGMTRHLPKVAFGEAVERVTASLKQEGFGVLTTIDIQATLKKKLDVEMPAYTILGACNPSLAHRAIQAEPMIGLLLPCNVLVADDGEGGSTIAIASPRAMFSATGRDDLDDLVGDAEAKLGRALAAV